MTNKTPVTPMMAQYFSIKENYKDCLLFYRLGDFYELFYEDALIASKELEITLTARNKNADNPVPMCGVPHHSATEYIKTLVDRGFKVAICEQLEDAKLTKGMVKRDVVQVLTPGTIIDPKNRDEKSNHYLAALVGNGPFSLAYCDIATGEFKVTLVSSISDIEIELGSLPISELLVTPEFENAIIQKWQNSFSFAITSVSNVNDTKDTSQLVGEELNPLQKSACYQLLSYIQDTQKRELVHLQNAEVYDSHHYLVLDANAKVNLELTSNVRTKQKQGSLLWQLDQTKTAMGGRLLKNWIDRPLINKDMIIKRHEKVLNLMNHYFEKIDLIQLLKSIYDLERLVAKVSFGTINPREMIQLKLSLQQIPSLKQYLAQMNDDGIWTETLNDLPDLSELVSLIERAIVDEPPISAKDGGIINAGYHELLNQYVDAMRNGKQWIANLQQKEREETGIKTLKIGYNRIFGYYIEVTKGQLHALDSERYTRKQTLANAERFVTPELKETERIILEAQEKSMQLEYELFVQVRETIKRSKVALQLLAKSVAALDVLQSFATVSEEYRYVQPTFSQDGHLLIENGRHPVVERVIGIDKYVANHITMTPEKPILLMTGPNMSGKSTYMRQLALTVIMAQIGCFVPATFAKLPIFDRIFTRIGAADDLFSGQSTFMVEMMETNVALKYATKNSLLLFDEIGRGTATYDGMALAEAILRYVSQKVDAKAIFSTHYHELTVLENEIASLKNIHVGAIEQNGNLIFLHRIQEGPSDKSYGLNVAQLAGLPNALIEDASRILKTLESQSHTIQKDDRDNEQLNIVSHDQNDAVIEALKQINVNQMTPLEALLAIENLQQQIN